MMEMVPVNDSEVRWTVLKYMVGLIELGEIEPLLQSGMTPALLELLRTRRMSDIARIAKDTSIRVELRVDPRQLNVAFMRLDDIVRDQQLLEYYVRHQLPSALLARIFKKNSAQLREMRAALCGTDSETVGRPSLPDIAVRERIHAAWSDICKKYPERQRFYELHQLFPDHALNQLSSVINEFGDYNPPAQRRTSAVRST